MTPLVVLMPARRRSATPTGITGPAQMDPSPAGREGALIDARLRSRRKWARRRFWLRLRARVFGRGRGFQRGRIWLALIR